MQGIHSGICLFIVLITCVYNYVFEYLFLLSIIMRVRVMEWFAFTHPINCSSLFCFKKSVKKHLFQIVKCNEENVFVFY